MKSILQILQIILSILLIIVVLLQKSEAGLGSAFGGGGGNVYTTKRGADKVLFNATIVISILFFAVAIISLFV